MTPPSPPSRTSASPATIRAALAAAAFDLAAGAPLGASPLGAITLHPHQQTATARLRRALYTHGGALLADAVGLGKTWVALALLREAHTPIVIAPAALCRMWRDRAAIARVPLALHSTESFSAPSAPTLPAHPGLVVVDEAHHFRTPTTRRHTRLATLCAHAPVLLLSATPVHNTTRDLTALLALFLGERATTLDPATLAHLIVRRRHTDLRVPGTCAPRATSHLPAIAPTVWHTAPAAPAVWRALLALPPPIPPADGGHAPTLATLTLVRLLASSDAALRAALRRRLARAAALAHAAAAGHHLHRRTLSAWAAHDGALQLPFFLDGPTSSNAAALARHVETHAAALRHTLATLDAAPPTDPARIAWLRTVRARHPGARIVAFTQFADTARAVFRALTPDGHAALLTAAGGRIASGPLTREAILARFAPRATGAPDPPTIERIDLLVATDCLSEGLDLRDASVIVHLDLPWTPARLAQRVGRAARIDAPHAAIHVYALRPDPHVARWLRLARRFRTKARAARHALGARNAGDPDLRLARHMAVHRQLERWLGHHPPHPAPPATAVRCGRSGFVAICHLPGTATARTTFPTLLAALDGRPPTAAPDTTVRALRQLARADAAVVTPPPHEVATARAAIDAWLQRHAALRAVGAGPRPLFVPTGASRDPVLRPVLRATLARADAALRAAPPHARAGRAATVTALRDTLGHPLSAGAERALARLDTSAEHDTWLANALDATTSDTTSATPAGPASEACTAACPTRPRIATLVILVP